MIVDLVQIRRLGEQKLGENERFRKFLQGVRELLPSGLGSCDGAGRGATGEVHRNEACTVPSRLYRSERRRGPGLEEDRIGVCVFGGE
jgi:hypothetical protein